MRTRWIPIITAAAVLSVLGACGGADGEAIFTWPNTLVEVSPLEGTTAGGTQVTLRGSGFTDPALKVRRVLFGEEPAASWEVVDDTTIRCVAPPGALGSTVITLWGPDEAEPMLTGGFRYVALTLYVADGAGAASPNLYRVDLDTGRTSPVGPIGYPVAALATRSDGWIFAVEDDALRRLIRIDPATGAGRAIALLREVDTAEVPDIVDLTFVGSRLLGQAADGRLVEIDIQLGGVSVVDPSPQPGNGSGLAESEGIVYLTPEPGDPIYTWDPETGQSVQGPPMSSSAADAFDGIAVLDGIVFGVQVDPGGLSEPVLVRVDPHTGDVQVLGPLPPDVGSVTNDV